MDESDRATPNRTRLAKLAAASAVLLLALPFSPAGVARDDGVRVELSRSALYGLTHDADDAAQLVDGQREGGTMWLSRGAVGWYNDGRPIEITVRYAAARLADRVCLHLGQRPSAGALLPQSIDVFGSAGRDGLMRWLGAAQPPGLDTVDPETYRDHNACVGFRATPLAAIRFVINPRGAYFFTDEINARWLSGKKGAESALDAGSPIADPVSFGLRRSEILARVRSAVQSAPASVKSRRAELLAAMDAGEAGSDQPGLEHITRTLGNWRVQDADPSEKFRLVPADPFEPAASLDLPGAVADPVLVVASGQTEIAAASLVSLDPRGGRFFFTFAVDGAPPRAFSASLTNAHDTLAADGTTVADVLRPIAGPIDVFPGQQRMIWASVRAAPGAPTGVFLARLTARDQVTGAEKTIVWTIRSHRFVPPQNAFASVAWAYPDRAPLARYPQRAAKDLLDHGVDVGVLPASLLPWPIATRGGSPKPDFRTFDRSLNTFAKSQRVLLYLGFKGPDDLILAQLFGTSTTPFGPEWNRRFTAWIAALAGHLRSKGHGPGRIAFYPVDEPGNPSERALLVHLAKLIRQGAPGYPVYTTLREIEGVDESFLASADILQLDEANFDAAFTRRLKGSGKQVWLYSAEKTGKSADPRTVYRAIPWRAFAAGLSGAGIWSYSQNGDDGSPWDDLDGTQADRAMVYPDAAGWFASRRWEAWRLGNQDAAVMQAALERATTPANRTRVQQLAATGAAAQRDPAKLLAVRSELLELATPR